MHYSLARRLTRAVGPIRAVAVTGVLVAGTAVGLTAAASASVTSAARPAVAPAAAGATLTLTSSSGLPDQSVGFTGSGYRARESVTVHWRSASGSQLAKLTASKSGTISGSFRVPVPKSAAKVTVVAVGAASKRQGKAAFTQSCGDEWTDLKGGNWSTARDWSRGTVPGATSNACITLAGSKSYTVVLNQLSGSIAIGSLRVGASGGKTTQTLEMDANGSDQSLGLARTSTIAGRGVFKLTSSGNGSDFIEGTGTLDNYGLLSFVTGKGWSRYLYGDVVNEASGTTSIGAGKLPAGYVYQTNGSAFVNKGTLKILKGSEYQVNLGAFTQSGGHISNAGIVSIGNATVAKDGGTSTGNAWQFTGGVLKDKAGTGSYTFYDSGTISGTIPKGQTVTVYGNGSDDELEWTGNVTNDGTIVLTTGHFDGNAPGNSWLSPLPGDTATLHNNGTVKTSGTTYTRYFNVNVINNPKGIMDLDSNSNLLDEGDTLTNDGTLDFGAGSVFNLTGGSYGQAELKEGSTATTGIVLDGAKTPVIDQFFCSAGGCQNSDIELAGKLAITAIGTPSGSYMPIYSQVDPITKMFASSTTGYTLTYNAANFAIPNLAGDVEITKS